MISLKLPPRRRNYPRFWTVGISLNQVKALPRKRRLKWKMSRLQVPQEGTRRSISKKRRNARPKKRLKSKKSNCDF